MNYYLGIDIGTTKVATVICDSAGRIVELESRPTKAAVNSIPEYFEQDSGKIFAVLDQCITALAARNLKQVVSIGVTGQMHGIILWGQSKVSKLITWQDKRCKRDDFLQEIKQYTGEKLSSGFGSATLAWLVKNNQLDAEYQHAATIHDYLVACLCALKHPVMDPTNAASWGLFDMVDQSWQIENIQNLNIPEKLYPKLVASGSTAGKLTAVYAEKWNLPPDIPVITAIGDNQASLLATIHEWDKEISLTIGTGAQVSVILPDNFNIDAPTLNSCEYRPFINGRYIAVGAPLCGGSAFAWLIKWFGDWCKSLGLPIPEDKKLYGFFIEQGLKKTESNLCIETSFLGERHNPELTGKINNINLDNFTPGNVANTLAAGIISNLKIMIPEELLEAKEYIIASGNALRHNPLLVKHAEAIFGKTVKVIDSREEAACGAAKLAKYTNHYLK